MQRKTVILRSSSENIQVANEMSIGNRFQYPFPEKKRLQFMLHFSLEDLIILQRHVQ